MSNANLWRVLLLLSLAAAARAQSDPPVLDARQVGAQIERIGTSARERDAVPALAIAVSRGEGASVFRGFGWADAASSSGIGEHTVFRIGSLTRQFTAVALLKLAEEQKLDLDLGIETFLPEFPLGKHKVSVRQLLANTSGIPGTQALLAKHPEVADKAMGEKEFFALFQDVPFAFEPGSGFALDSGSVWLLPILVGRISAQPCEDYVRKSLLRPLGLEDTRQCPQDSPSVVGLSDECSKITDSKDLEVPLVGAPKSASISLCSSAADLLLWNRALRDGVLLDEASLKVLRQPTLLADGSSTGHGCGLGLGRLEQQDLEYHTGGVAGFRVRTAHYPQAGLTIVVLANCASAPVERIERDIAQRLLGQLPLALVDLQLDVAELARLEGVYQLETTRLEIQARAGKLWYVLPGQPAEALLAQSATVFFKGSERDTRLTFTGDGARADGFDLLRGGFTSRAKRFDSLIHGFAASRYP